MEFTIIISCYKNDNPELLKLAIDSCNLDQKLQAKKIILVVDGPAPIALEECINTVVTQHKNVYILRKENNTGLADSLNHAIKLVKTKYVARMDADDICLPDRFFHQVTYLENNPKVGILGGAIIEFNDNQGIINKKTFPINHNDCKKTIYKSSPFNHPTIIARTDILRAHPYHTGLTKESKNAVSSTEDLELWFRLMNKGVFFANLDRPVLLFRIDNNFYSRRGRTKSIQELYVYLKGIKLLFGTSLKSIYPILRFLIRMSPDLIKKLAYKSRKTAVKLTEKDFEIVQSSTLLNRIKSLNYVVF